MVNLRSAADRAERESVNLLVGGEGVAGKLYAHVADDAAVVVVVVAAVLGARAALDLHLDLIVASLAADDETAPVARLTAASGILGREDDRLLGRALGKELAATLNDEGSLGLLVALDDCARLDGERCAVGNVDPALEGVGALLQRLLAIEDEALVAVADYVTFEEEIVAGLQAAVLAPVVGRLTWRIVIVVVASHKRRSCNHAGHERPDE